MPSPDECEELTRGRIRNAQVQTSTISVQSLRNPTDVDTKVIGDVLLMKFGVSGSVLPNIFSHLGRHSWAANQSTTRGGAAVHCVSQISEFWKVVLFS